MTIFHRSVLLTVLVTAVGTSCSDQATPRAPQDGSRKEPASRAVTLDSGKAVGAKPMDGGHWSLKEFGERFRRAVLDKDIEWVLSRMDPAGWSLGDVHLKATEYASEFRKGNLDYDRLFGGSASSPRSPVSAEGVSFRDWFARCPGAIAKEEWDDPRPDSGSAYIIRWEGAACPANRPAIRVLMRAEAIVIRSIGD